MEPCAFASFASNVDLRPLSVKSTELFQAYERVWRAFSEVDETADGRHDTSHWRAHTEPFAACVVRVNAGELRPGFGLLRRELEQLHGVRQHPDHFLHIMLQELGFVVDDPRERDEISSGRLEEFAQAAIEPASQTSPFRVTIGGVNAFQDAIFLEVGSGEGLVQLHARLFELAAIPGIPDFSYVPHATIAHFDGTASHAGVTEALTPWRRETMGELLIHEIEVVLIDPSQPYPELESFAVIPLKS